jgi:hypothetical protein
MNEDAFFSQKCAMIATRDRHGFDHVIFILIVKVSKG